MPARHLWLPVRCPERPRVSRGLAIRSAAGLEWKFARGWSPFGEYNYLDFGTRSSNLYSTGLADPSLGFGATDALSDTVSLRFRSQQALVGVNYRFDWAGPVVTRY